MPTNKKGAKPIVKKVVKKVSAVKAPAKMAKKKAAPNKTAKPIAKKAQGTKAQAPIKKSIPVKQSAKPVIKNAAPKKLNKAPQKITLTVKKTPAPEVQANKSNAKAPEKQQSKNGVKNVSAKQAESKGLPKAKDIKVPPPKMVTLPKITSTKSRKYEPEFTKSVLDPAAVIINTPSMRYSDPELTEFRELINRKLETAKKELGYLQGLITRKDEMGGDDTDNRYMTMEDGSLSMEREQLSQMASRQITFIDHLEKAMMRIENKTYGICRVSGKLIDKARLRAVPHATLSMEAKMGMK